MPLFYTLRNLFFSPISQVYEINQKLLYDISLTLSSTLKIEKKRQYGECFFRILN